MNKIENINETLIASLEKFKLILKQNENVLKSKNESSSKSIFYKFSLEITKKNEMKKSTSHIYIFDITETLNDNLNMNREKTKSIMTVYDILSNFKDENKIINKKESKFVMMLQMILNKTFLVKGNIFLFIFISQKIESIESLEIVRKLLKLKSCTSISHVEDINLNLNLKFKELDNFPSSKFPQSSFCEIPPLNSNVHESFREDQGNVEVINHLENEVNYLKKMMLKKESDDYFSMSNHTKSYLQDSGRKYINDIYGSKNNLLFQNSNLVRSNCKNFLNSTTFTASKVKPFVNFMSSSKPSHYGYNPSENNYDLNSGNESYYKKDNCNFNNEDFVMKENADLKAQLCEVKRSLSDLIKDRENKIKNLSKILNNNESNLNEMQINYNEINLQYKELLDENKRKDDEIINLNENLKNFEKKNMNNEISVKIQEICQNNERINNLYNNEILKNNNLYIENEKLSSELQRFKSNNEKNQNEFSSINNELIICKNRASNNENVVNQLNCKNSYLNKEVTELKKKMIEIQRKKPMIVDKIHIPPKLGKICKCELYEKKIQSNVEEISKLNKELKSLKNVEFKKDVKVNENVINL